MKKNTAARTKAYKTFSIIVITLLAISFAFPLYWIITGSFKTGAAINATTPEWWPSEWVTANYQKLYSSHGRICTCKEKIYRTYDPLFSDRMCDGSSETGYFNPVIT